MFDPKQSIKSKFDKIYNHKLCKFKHSEHADGDKMYEE